MSDGDTDSVDATDRRAVRCNDVSRRSRASGSHRPVLPAMGSESKARRLRDRTQCRGGVDTGHRAPRAGDRRYDSSRRRRQQVRARHCRRDGAGPIRAGRQAAPGAIACTDADSPDRSPDGPRGPRGSRTAVALASTGGAGVEGGRATAIRACAVGALRRSLQPIARRMAPRGYACRASAGTRLHPRRRLDLRAARVTRTRADGPPGQKRLGLPVSRVPDQPAASLAASDDRCQGSGRLGAGECRPVRR